MIRIFKVSVFASNVKLAQLDRHESVNTRSEHYSPTVAGKLFADFILLRILLGFGKE